MQDPWCSSPHVRQNSRGGLRSGEWEPDEHRESRAFRCTGKVKGPGPKGQWKDGLVPLSHCGGNQKGFPYGELWRQGGHQAGMQNDVAPALSQGLAWPRATETLETSVHRGWHHPTDGL
jgi:hypothetical protein